MSSNVEVVEADARTADPAALLGSCAPYKMLGNLPYYAAMPILRRFLEAECRPERAAVLVQREVAEQMCAQPGAMSLVSLAVQLFGSARIARIVRPGSFTPPPKVTSAVVGITLHDWTRGRSGRRGAVLRAGACGVQRSTEAVAERAVRRTGHTAG